MRHMLYRFVVLILLTLAISPIYAQTEADTFNTDSSVNVAASPSLSSDGSVVAFWGAGNVGLSINSGDIGFGVFIHDRSTNSTQYIPTQQYQAHSTTGNFYPAFPQTAIPSFSLIK